jgi:hypothetical protein
VSSLANADTAPMSRSVAWRMASAAGWPEVYFRTLGGANTWHIGPGREPWEGVILRAWPALLRAMAGALDTHLRPALASEVLTHGTGINL